MYCYAESALVGVTLFQGFLTAEVHTPKEARLCAYLIVVAAFKLRV